MLIELGQCLVEIGDDVVWVFQTHRKPYQTIVDAHCRSLLRRHVLVGDRWVIVGGCMQMDRLVPKVTA